MIKKIKLKDLSYYKEGYWKNRAAFEPIINLIGPEAQFFKILFKSLGISIKDIEYNTYSEQHHIFYIFRIKRFYIFRIKRTYYTEMEDFNSYEELLDFILKNKLQKKSPEEIYTLWKLLHEPE